MRYENDGHRLLRRRPGMRTLALVSAVALGSLWGGGQAAAQRFETSVVERLPAVNAAGGSPPVLASSAGGSPRVLASSAGGVWLAVWQAAELPDPPAARVLRSRDDGLTWDAAVVVPDFYPTRLATRDGTWLATWSQSTAAYGHRAAVHVATSRDTGATWLPPVVASPTGPLGRYVEAHDPAAASDGTAWVLAWTERRQNPDESLVVTSRSTDGGATWSSPVTVGPGYRPHLAQAPGGGFVLLWRVTSAVSPSPTTISAAWSPDGAAWEPDGSLAGVDTIDLATAPSGALVALVRGRTGPDTAVGIAIRRPGAGSWERLPASVDGFEMRLAAGPHGTAAVLSNRDERPPKSASRSATRHVELRRFVVGQPDVALTELGEAWGDYWPSPAGDIVVGPSGTWMAAFTLPYTRDGIVAVQLHIARATAYCGDGLRNAGETCDATAPREDQCCSVACAPANEGVACSDPSACATGTCTDGRCAHPVTRCHPCDVCDGAGTCAARLRDDCTVPTARSRLALRVGSCPGTDCADTLAFDWRADVAGGRAAFGRPATDGVHRLCTFVSRAGATRILFGTELPATCRSGPCWTRRRRGWDFVDGGGPVERLRLRARTARRSRLALAASGPDLFRAPAEPGDRVTFQLEAPNGACWAAQALIEDRVPRAR